MSGMEPTVNSVVAQPAFWYYMLAGGGALLLLAAVTVVVILCCHRYHWATKKTSGSHHHSVVYHNSRQPNQPGYQNPNLSYNLIHSPNQNHLYPGTGLSLEPMLTVGPEKDDSYDSQYWNDSWKWNYRNVLFKWSDKEEVNRMYSEETTSLVAHELTDQTGLAYSNWWSNNERSTSPGVKRCLCSSWGEHMKDVWLWWMNRADSCF